MIKLLGKEQRLQDIELLKESSKKYPELTFILIFDPSFEESKSYINSIIKVLEKVNWKYVVYELTNTFNDFEVLSNFAKVKSNMIILARPVKVNEEKLLSLIPPYQDPDMLTSENKGKLYDGNLNYLPATAMSVRRLIENYNIDVASKKVLILGRSISVGLPIFMYFQRKNATCILAHSRTTKSDLDKFTKEADIIVLATGKQDLIDRKLLNDKQVIIDCGFNSNGRGDLNFVPGEDELYAYTPVPGGVGPLTITSLLLNSLFLYILNKENK